MLRNYGNCPIRKLSKSSSGPGCSTESPPDQAKINQICTESEILDLSHLKKKYTGSRGTIKIDFFRPDRQCFCSRYISEQMTDTGVYLVAEREGRRGVNSYNQKVLRITKTVWKASH